VPDAIRRRGGTVIRIIIFVPNTVSLEFIIGHLDCCNVPIDLTSRPVVCCETIALGFHGLTALYVVTPMTTKRTLTCIFCASRFGFAIESLLGLCGSAGFSLLTGIMCTVDRSWKLTEQIDCWTEKSGVSVGSISCVDTEYCLLCLSGHLWYLGSGNL
jgi:hypothetical protein